MAEGSGESGRRRGVTRRALLVGGGVAAAAAGAGGLTAWAVSDAGTRATPAPADVREWVRRRGSRYVVAHRGSGDVLPEHSMEAYRAAVDWGAPCLEISVGITSDGVLICMHDQTYDRTTTATGRLVDQPSRVLATARIWQPQLGDYWLRNAPRIPRFEEVLQAFGGRAVLAVEAKVDRAYEPMMAMVQRYGLQHSVLVKSHVASRRWGQAQRAGYPVFCYFGTASETTVEAVQRVAAALRPAQDCLVLPADGPAGARYLPDELVAAAVGSGVPVWVFPVHRRSDADHYARSGVQGLIASSYGYVAGATRPVTADAWRSQAVAPGEMSRSPASLSWAPTFTADGELVLALQGRQHFLTLGQCCPTTAAGPSCTVEVDASWRVLPHSGADNLTVAFGCVDDSYYEHRQGVGDGYHAILRADGELGLYRHVDGQAAGRPLAPAVATPPLVPGGWVQLRIEVTADGVRVSRTDADASVSAPDTSVRGGYLHVGRSSTDGVAAFRNLRIR
ncbi:glycerophosphodiester phosphodiesterase [Nakamurella endophytica]|uniref:GP-PDE domain-containing protein n=1 Tax=Nakamurella endophytica TaxID=1748367 RepID=A0A917SRQ5_9ACTN|nr:glycerophosphodiester phosphodiesterase family protein [Nakamurella endophytica]GGL94252.1 hypothetical protein GCM10011594_12600 [Nakamurella endophytica]